MLKVVDLVKQYNKNLTPINHLDLEINQGDVLSIIGPSGTGKSTLLRMFNLLETPTSGQIFFNDIEITNRKTNKALIRRKIGMVFQSYTLFSTMTVLQNVMCGPIDLLKMDKEEAEKQAYELLNKVGMLSHKNHFPHELSGGQRQRVAIARALSMNPEILLLDEPTSALDPTMVNEVKEVIEQLANNGMTMVIVTHDMSFAKKISTKVAFLSNGKVLELGTPEEIFEHPKQIETINFIEQLSSLNIEIMSDSFSYKKSVEQIKTFKENLMTKTVLDTLINLFKVFHKLIIEHQEISKAIVSIGYSSKTNCFSMNVLYDGSNFNLAELISNKESLKNVEDIQYKEQNSNGCTNLISIIIKKDL